MFQSNHPEELLRSLADERKRRERQERLLRELRGPASGCHGSMRANGTHWRDTDVHETTVPGTEPGDPRRDFDFFIGTWQVRHYRLMERLKASNSWEEFETTGETWRIWGGAANITQIVGETPSGRLNGMAVRLFEDRTMQWRIYWASRVAGVMDEPLIGGFREGRGEFFNHELWEGRGVFVRNVWSDVTHTSCRWDQAFSGDGGSTWETNWVMEFSRA